VANVRIGISPSGNCGQKWLGCVVLLASPHRTTCLEEGAVSSSQTFLFSSSPLCLSIMALESIHPLIHWIPAALSLGIKAVGVWICLVICTEIFIASPLYPEQFWCQVSGLLVKRTEPEVIHSSPSSV